MAKNPVIGMNASFGIGIEDVEGTPVAADLWFDVSAIDCEEAVTLHEPGGVATWHGGTPSIEDEATPAVPAKIDNKVGMTCEPRFTHLPRLLGLIFGGDCAGSTYVPTAEQKSFSVESDQVAEAESGKSVDQFAGSKLSTVTIKSEANKALTIQIAGPARTVDHIAGTAVDWSAWGTKAPMMHHNLSIVTGPTEIPVGQVYDIEVEISRAVEEDHFANSLTRVCAPSGKLTATGKLTVPFNDETAPIRAKVRAGTLFALQPRWAGEGDETFDLLMQCKATNGTKKISDQKGQRLEIEFRCLRNGDDRGIQAVLGS